ncbi:hypothetical protein THTE_1689 [Thermogutta terrifontis]|uniref:Uncharacterized protein n=1 Tax=Thermogutta terrifontis TaxID=1331910 RepID=A0A286REA6_9BACT|nr:hypothetical protein THTE_1689 [Thermogutta terrifontis]
MPWLRGLERKSLVRRPLANNGRWLCPPKEAPAALPLGGIP